MHAFLQGFALGLSLIIAIGAQNALVLRYGLRGEHVLLVCLACALSDALLIVLGVLGFHLIVQEQPWVVPVARYGGAIFLFFYGALSLHSCLRGTRNLVTESASHTTWGATLGVCLALTWLNPHVYLDTVVLIGMVSTQFGARDFIFASGAMLASFVFFFSLGYGARLLRPLFAQPIAWRMLDVFICIVMWSIALSLVLRT